MTTSVDTIQQLQARIEALEYVLRGLLMSTTMKADKYRRGWWMCPICRSEHQGLDDLERGIGHDDECDYALARKLLKGD